jgi:hypothetical protein
MVDCPLKKFIFKITKVFQFDHLFSIIRFIYSTDAAMMHITGIDFIARMVKNNTPCV